MELSVIIPTYNEERRLPQLLASLKSQTFKDFEIIVADNNSKDKTRKIAKKAGAKICSGGLPAVGRNRGAAIAKGERIVFIDADVTFNKNFFSNSLIEIKKRGISIAGVPASTDDKNLINKFLFGFWNFYVRLTQWWWPHAAGYCIFSTKKIHQKIKGFDERMTLADDANYVLRASKHGRFRILHQWIQTSSRRLKTEGRFGMAKKMIFCEFRRVFIGEPINDEYNYFSEKHEEQHITSARQSVSKAKKAHSSKSH